MRGINSLSFSLLWLDMTFCSCRYDVESGFSRKQVVHFQGSCTGGAFAAEDNAFILGVSGADEKGGFMKFASHLVI